MVAEYDGVFSSADGWNPGSNIAPPLVQVVTTFILFVVIVVTMLASGCGSSIQTSPQPSLMSIAVTPTGASIGIQATQQFTAMGIYSDSSRQNLTNSATWTSSDTSKATITTKGLATGVAAGSTTITATSGGVNGSTSLSVRITPALISIAVAPVNPSVAVGNTLQFTATGSYSDGSTQILTGTVTWSSSVQGVATISAAGLATGVSVGSSTISATLSGITGSTTLSVTSTSVSPVTEEWLEFVGDGSDGTFTCTSGKCSLGGEHWFSSFNVSAGATVVTSGQTTPIVIRSTGTCTVAGTISNSSNSGVTTNTGPGDFGGGGGGGGGGTASGHTGQLGLGDAAIEIVTGGSGGAAGGGNGGPGGTPAAAQYKLLLSGGTFWPVGGAVGGQGGSNGAAGGWGGVPVILVCNTISFTGTIDVSGGPGGASPGNNSGAGGGGGAGYVILSAVSYSPPNSGTIKTAGGPGGSCNSHTSCGTGGNGGSGWSVAITIP